MATAWLRSICAGKRPAIAEEILDRAIPDRREVVASYLAYVLSHNRQAAIAGAAMSLQRCASIEDLPLLYAATDAVLDPDLWQALGNARPNGITHPNFEEPRIGPRIRLAHCRSAGSDSPVARRSPHPVQRPAARIVRTAASGRRRASSGYGLHVALGNPHAGNRFTHRIGVANRKTAPARSQPATIGPRER